MTARPVVTMDLDTGRMFVDDTYVGYVDESAPGVSFGAFALTFEAHDLRAIADFLEQLEGANLLSEVVATCPWCGRYDCERSPKCSEAGE